jgi:hypothetical protein
MGWSSWWRRWWSSLSVVQRYGVVLGSLVVPLIVVAVVAAVVTVFQDSTPRSAQPASPRPAPADSAGPTRSAEGTTGFQAGYRVAASYPEEDCDYAAELMVNAAGGVESAAEAGFLRDYLQGCEAWHDEND